MLKFTVEAADNSKNVLKKYYISKIKDIIKDP